ncbi:MAG: DegT/DnrJ/EryC1/StrS family aminotransferase [Chitinophagaceae bacterium]|nr:DegT/DnrJ/EryC1/StrS family aminotransferase [Chitinophagaceae bacterium]
MISVFGSKYTQEDIDAVVQCLESNWTGIGKNVTAFEQQFRERLGSEHFMMVDSGSNALYLALKNLQLPKGGEVILPSFTWVSCAQAVLLNGLVPVFCDVDLYTQNVTAELIAEKISNKTAAIMVVHYAGLPVDMAPILALGYPVLEDAAHAVDSTVDGTYCGVFGDAGIWSFDSVKNIAVGEGGGIWFKEKERIDQSRMMRYCGIGFSGFQAASNNNDGNWWEYDIQQPNVKMLPSDIEGALAVVQLKHLPVNQQRRKAIWDYYQQAFANTAAVTIPVACKPNETHSYFTYFIQVPAARRNALAKHLYEKGIYSTLRYHPLHLNAIYQSTASLPNSEQLNATGLNIPLHQNLTDEQVELIAVTINDFL